MKFLIFISIIIPFLSGCTKTDEKVEKIPDIPTPIIDTIQNATEESIRISVYNYMSAIELDVLTMLIDGTIPKVYTNANLPIYGTKPTKVEVTLKDGKVYQGFIQYENYFAKIENGVIQEISKKQFQTVDYQQSFNLYSDIQMYLSVSM